MKKRLILLLFSAFFALPAKAGVLLDFDFSNLSDSITSASTSSQTKTYYSGGLYVNVDSKERYYLGASIVGASSSDELNSGTTSFSTLDYVLGFKWFMNKGRTFIASGGYGISSTATYSDPTLSASERWTGNSMMFKLTAAPQIKDWNIGLSLVMYQGTFVERNVNNTTSAVSYTKTFVFPCLGVSWTWN